MDIYFSSYKEKYKSPFGAGKPGTVYRLTIYSSEECEMTLRVFGKEIGDVYVPMEKKEGGFYSASFEAPEKPSLLFYYFILSLPDGSTYYYGNCEERLGGEGRIYADDPVPYQITVY